MNRKMILFDVDGTILSREQIVPRSAVHAIRSVREKGNIAVLFTGRPLTHVEPGVLEIGFDACICTMGAFIKIGDRVLQDIRPSSEYTGKVVALVRACALDSVYESGAGISFDRTRPLNGALAGLKLHFARRGLNTQMDIDAPGFLFEKLCVWSNDRSDMGRFEEEVTQYLDVIGKKQNMMEMVAKGVSIAESVGVVMAHFGISRENCYAIGDSINDLPMLRCAAHTAAMGEAADELKRQVEFVTKGILDDGLAHAMEQFGFMEQGTVASA